jgi:putative FmdB family regulatory protein
MPTYEYECEACGLTFEHRQAITEEPITECPKCRGKVERLVSGGVGFILKGSSHGQMGQNKQACSLEQVGKTCCGLGERCGKPPCGERS